MIEREWDAEAVLSKYEAELRQSDMGDVEMGKRLLEESVPMAVLSIRQLSQHAGDDRVRLRASEILIQRGLDIGREREADPLLQMIEKMHDMEMD